ncbi:protein madd-4-like isoform X2 [Schistocerca gregaria]|uniref:protein madd-4-like isoform X2 n=2 Tax=Schistocerca gregaria TaxID=7010 RepID=UPI00211E0E70|nr:protein madd-4-like isoform X2 [Schistocerca gregaria]
MRTLCLLVALLLLALAVGSKAADNATLLPDADSDTVGGDGNFMSNSLDQLEMELVEQQPSAERRGAGWAPWSTWSACSRTCDGGVASSLRRCQAAAGCVGESIRYKICNMQACPEPGDFRAQQCSSFDKEPWRGAELRWLPHPQEAAPCALTCRATRPDGSHVVATLAARVQDGTRCRPGSLDMCISGQCQRVGCDLRIGSSKRVDTCGVCGGDGSSCAKPLFHWEHASASLCSAPCGGGRKMSRPVCRNRVTGAEADEKLCNASQKPPRLFLSCNAHRCPAKWVPDPWGPCSATCGSGHRRRGLRCLQQEGNGSLTLVADSECRGPAPHQEESCKAADCPTWRATPWSPCSATCGAGVQTRTISCGDAASPAPPALCDAATRPVQKQACHSGVVCPGPVYRTGEEEEALPGQDHTQPLVQPYPPTDGSFMAGKWGPCSVTCGIGIRTRDVYCRIYLEFSKAYAKMPDENCQGPKPSEFEKCKMQACEDQSMNDTLRDSTQRDPASTSHISHGDPDIKVKVAPGSSGPYSWKSQGFTHCSASCLGGVQESLISCVQDNNQKTVSPYLCDKETRPEVLIRTCNDHPCPPRWNYSDFQPCSKPCGIGIRTREVMCIHEVTRGGGNTVIVPNNMCPQPPPPDRQYCNVLDCPVKWHTKPWSKCSKPCGGGIKTREVECLQVMAQNHIVPRPTSQCPTSKPADKKPCNTKACSTHSDRPIIDTENKTFIQKNSNEKKVSLKIGGQAVVFAGVQVKIRCPVRRFNRTKIQWEKNNTQIVNSKKFKITKKGALRIQNLNFRDNGKYSCIAGLSRADLFLSVKQPLVTSSEELERHSHNRLQQQMPMNDKNIQMTGARRDLFSQDLSHETQPEGQMKLGRTWSSQSSSSTLQPSLSSPEPPGVKLGEFSAPTSSSGSLEDHSPQLSSASSGSSRAGVPAMPHFQQLLEGLQEFLPFQAFSSPRGLRTIPETAVTSFGAKSQKEEEEEYGDDYFEYDNENPVFQLGEQDNITEESTEEPVISLRENLKFDWMITEWSKCSQTCGNGGFQVRAAHCMLHVNGSTQSVENRLCEDAGLPVPPTMQNCGLEFCPRWTAGNWSLCEESRCFTWNTAMQRRDVTCLLSNGTEVNGLCNESEKPPVRQECYNDKCKGTWKVGEWSECTAPCEMQGIKYRILQCVWYGTKKPAGNACREQPRPPVMKVCMGPPCAQVLECKDQSKYCQIVRTMKVCGMYQYQYQCCQSCRSKG